MKVTLELSPTLNDCQGRALKQQIKQTNILRIMGSDYTRLEVWRVERGSFHLNIDE